ncbi:MAG: hypothetical protein ABFS38_17505 [Bacteroidota bacterium]
MGGSLRPVIEIIIDDVFQKVKITLFSQPDPAADKLIIVLEEISKIYVSLDNELTSFLALSLDSNMTYDQVNEIEEDLLNIEGGELIVRVSEARGHCSKINNIYNMHLQGWFGSSLSREQNNNVPYPAMKMRSR